MGLDKQFRNLAIGELMALAALTPLYIVSTTAAEQSVCACMIGISVGLVAGVIVGACWGIGWAKISARKEPSDG